MDVTPGLSAGTAWPPTGPDQPSGLDRERRQVGYAARIVSGLARDPGRVVLRWRDRSITAGELRGCVLGAAAALRRGGLGGRDTVAVLTGTNHPAMLTARYAAHLLGAAVVHIRSENPRSDAVMLDPDTQARILRQTGARILVTDAEHLDRARWLSETLPGRFRLAGFGLAAAGVDDLGTGNEPAAPPDVCEVAPAACAVIAFTSGSTGQPKSVVQSFGVWDRMVDVLAGDDARTGPATLLAVTPISHTTGSMADAVLAAGGRLVLHERFDAEAVLRAVAAERVTDTYLAVPHLYQLVDLLTDPRAAGRAGAGADLSSLRRVVYSGTPAAPRRIAEAVAVFGDVLVQLYGSTEAGGISALTGLDHREPELLGSVGRPFDWVRVRICDPVTGAEVPRGQPGELWVSSPTTMDGYLGDAASTARTLAGGWLRTGDLGHWDRYGYLRLVGRVGDVIKRGGIKIYPTAVEQALLAHPEVTGAAVFGVPDADRVEHVHAAVTLRPGRTGGDPARTVADLRDRVGGTLSPLHVPDSISVWDELPLNDAGKPDTAYLRSLGERDQRGSA